MFYHNTKKKYILPSNKWKSKSLLILWNSLTPQISREKCLVSSGLFHAISLGLRGDAWRKRCEMKGSSPDNPCLVAGKGGGEDLMGMTSGESW